MKYVTLILKWINIVVKIVPVIEKLYTQIMIAVEVIKEEVKNPDEKGTMKKINVTQSLRDSISLTPGKLGRAVDSTVKTLNEIGVL